MNKRLSTRGHGIQSQDAFERTIDLIAQLSVQLRILQAKMDKKLQAVRDEHGPAIQAVSDQIGAHLELAEAYAFEHKDEVFGPKRKSAATKLAEYGLRIGQPTLKTLNRRWTWAKVLEAVKATLPGRYVRTKEDLDKESIRAQLGNDPAALATIGLRIEQTEAFWVEPKDNGGEG